MTRSEHIRALLEEYARQRAEDERTQQARVAQACAKVPEIARLREESAGLAIGAMRGILSLSDRDERRAAAEEMKNRGRAINARIRALLKEAGLPEDALEMRYRCPQCRDTGYVGEAPARFCACFETRLRLRQYEDGSMAGPDEQNFDRFNAAFIPEEDGQRQQMIKARNLCRDYADQYPDFRYRNLLLIGAVGLGKTFLLNCIFERVVARGHSAVRITAYRMNEAMRQKHIGGEDCFTPLIEAPLLLIDDLGTEPVLRNVTIEYLFTLLNERAVARRHTVVATNLTPEGIKERYGERVASRLLDRTSTGPVQLTGRDLRKQ